MDHNIAYELEYLGLTANEVKVYLTLLRIGSSQAGRLAKECNLERTSTYNALKNLIKQGIVSYVISSNKKVFSSANPEKIVDMFKEKQERASLIVPQLLNLQKFEKEKENIQKFNGFSGIKTVMNDILNSCNKGEEYLVLGMEGQLSKMLPVYAKIYVARKDKKKLRTRAIIRSQPTGHKMSKYTKVKYIFQNIPSNLSINIYKNKVALIIWTETPEAIIINNKETADAFRIYFEFMWQNAKE